MERHQAKGKPVHDTIRVTGVLDRSWSSLQGGLTVTPWSSRKTVLTGYVRARAALHGILPRIRDLGLPLLRVGSAEVSGEGRAVVVEGEGVA